MIDSSGLILTNGYVILEAMAIIVQDQDGKSAPAEVIGYDHDTGFGLIRALGPLATRPIAIGSSARLAESDLYRAGKVVLQRGNAVAAYADCPGARTRSRPSGTIASGEEVIAG